MQTIIFYVSAADTLGVVRDYSNGKNVAAPTLTKAVETRLKMRLFAGLSSPAPYPVTAFDNVVSWAFTMDKDFNPETSYVLEADDDSITVSSVTETIGGEALTFTEVDIPISNMDTTELEQWLGVAEAKGGLFGELIGFDAAGEEVFVLQIKNFTMRGRISSGGTPTPVDPEYLTAGQVRALIAAGVAMQFSTDASDWHDTQADADRYLRFRSASSASAVWSGAIHFPGGGGELPVGVKADYTAFEVIANDAEIPAGSTEYLGVNLAVNGVGTAVKIDAGMTHRCKFKTLGGKLIVDWGDGTIVTKDDTAPDGGWEEEHTYSAAGKYLVKVYGAFSRIQTVSGKNLIHRVLDFDLPLASTHTNLQEFAQNALRLVAVNFNDQMMASHIGQLTRLFSGCKNLRKVEKMNRLAVVASCNGLFQDCVNMRVCEFACPPVVALADDGGNGLRNVFYSTTQDAQWAVTLDLNSLFPTGGFAQDAVDLSNFFYHAGTRECFGNITLTAANAEKLAKKLWLSGKKFIGFSDLFLRLPAAVRKYIPYAWGGTMAGVYIDSATGCLPKWQGVEADYSWDDASFRNRFTGDAVELLCDAYDYGRIAATNCTVTFTDGFVSKGDVTLYGGTFSPNGGAVNILSAHYAVVDMSPMGMQSCALDHCYATGGFDVSTGTAVEVAGGTIVVTGSNRGAVFTLSDNALMTYADRVSEITVVYTKGCTINGEVKAAGGTIVVA